MFSQAKIYDIRPSPLPMEMQMSRRIDLAGKRFSAWLVLSYSGMNDIGQSTWLCRCDCGTERRVVAQTLRLGLTNSCGCLKGDAIARARFKHGGAFTKSYASWHDMMWRCTNPRARNFKYYGGRGITVCERWLDYRNFVTDMGEPPEGLTIERMNNDGNYEPRNCKWATHAEQNRNKRPPYSVTPYVGQRRKG